MSVVKYKGPNVTVANIVERNDLVDRPDQLLVTVLDAMGDTQVGRGWALYMWSKSRQSWMLISKEINDAINFVEEEKTITNDVVRSDFVPTNNIIWDCWIITPAGDVIDCHPLVDGSVIDIKPETPGQYDGCTVHYVYCYGSMSTQIASATYSKTEVDTLLTALRTTLEAQISALGQTIV